MSELLNILLISILLIDLHGWYIDISTHDTLVNPFQIILYLTVINSCLYFIWHSPRWFKYFKLVFVCLMTSALLLNIRCAIDYTVVLSWNLLVMCWLPVLRGISFNPPWQCNINWIILIFLQGRLDAAWKISASQTVRNLLTMLDWVKMSRIPQIKSCRWKFIKSGMNDKGWNVCSVKLWGHFPSEYWQKNQFQLLFGTFPGRLKR